jgi:hypothetical protein
VSAEAYPYSPGWKSDDTETSREAAKAIKHSADALRCEALALLTEKPLTADEVAEALRTPFMSDADFAEFKRSIRPRVSELKADGLVEKTLMRRKNSSGRAAVVWRAVKKYGQLTLI